MSKKTLILRIVAIACACVLLLLLLTAVLLNRRDATGDAQPTDDPVVTDGTGEAIDPTTDAEDPSGVGETSGLEGDSDPDPDAPQTPDSTQPTPTAPPPGPEEDTPDDTPLSTAPVVEVPDPSEETKNDFSVDFDDLLNGAN